MWYFSHLAIYKYFHYLNILKSKSKWSLVRFFQYSGKNEKWIYSIDSLSQINFDKNICGTSYAKESKR